jgi:hypothetical protein
MGAMLKRTVGQTVGPCHERVELHRLMAGVSEARLVAETCSQHLPVVA